jgi:ribosomal protein L37E
MTVWDQPVLFVLGIAGAVLVAGWLLRLGARQMTPDFECLVCGRRQRNVYAHQWRFCPFCGTPAPRQRPRY